MAATLQSFLVGTLALTFLVGVGLLLAFLRKPRADVAHRKPLRRMAFVTTLFHLVHSGEEWLTGFAQIYPERMGLSPWPDSLFVAFNATWIGIWLVSAASLPARWAYAPLWFLGVAYPLNAVAHPLMSLDAGGYFPGLISSPVTGVLGVLLLRQLVADTTWRSPR